MPKPFERAADALESDDDLDKIIHDYDGISKRSWSVSFASILNTLQQSQSYFSINENCPVDDTASYYSALQDGFHLQERSKPKRPRNFFLSSERQEFFWDSESKNDHSSSGERTRIMAKSSFQVFWHDLIYQIEPKYSISNLVPQTEQNIRSYLSSFARLASCGKQSNYDLEDGSADAARASNSPLTIIQQMSGSFKSGQLTAVVGPSGAGKTSLLNFLSRRQEEGYSGQLYLDNNDRRVKISTIPQHDHVPEYLTVRENLLFASRLKNPHENYDHQRNVEKVSKVLGLEDCLDTMGKNISGGQQKRLTIAQELLSKPDILILDEPTSGLDSLTCHQTLSVLRDLVKSSDRQQIDPIAIVLTIHQPEQEVFEIFDKVYVIANGGVAIYDGPPKSAVQFVEQHTGVKIPNPTYNPASFLIELASGEYGSEPIDILRARVAAQFEATRQEAFHRVAAKSCEIENSQETDPKTCKSISSTNLTKPSQVLKNFKIGFKQPNIQGTSYQQRTTSPTSSFNGSGNKPALYIDNQIAKGSSMSHGRFWTKTGILAKRYWLSIIRDPKQMIARFAFHLILPMSLALLMGTRAGPANACPNYRSEYSLNELMRDDKLTGEEVQEDLYLTLENLSIIFMIIYSSVSANIGAITLSFCLDMQTSLKEYHNGWYTMPSYLLARILSDIPMGTVLPFMSLIIGYPLTNQLVGGGLPNAYRLLLPTAGIVLGSMVGQTMGMIFGAIYLGHVSAALFASQGATLPLVFISGFVVRLKNMSKLIYYFSYLSYYRHSLEIAMISRYGFTVCECDPATISGNDTKLVGVSDRLRNFAEYYMTTMGEEATKGETATGGGSNGSTVMVAGDDPKASHGDLFDMFAKQVSLYNTYGFEVKSCQDVVPYLLREFDLRETDLGPNFISLTVLLLATIALLFLVVRLVVRFRTSL